MAARTYKRPALTAVHAAKRDLEAVKAEVREHVQVCHQCAKAHGHPAKVCDTGWELAKRLTRTGNAVDRAELAELSRCVQGTLW